jgi:hypothetical protein
MLRPLVMSILGWRVVVGFRSTNMQATPRRASSSATVMPTGAAPRDEHRDPFHGVLSP